MPRRRHHLDDRPVDACRRSRSASAGVEPGDRRVAPHPAGVRALVAVEDPLVVLGRGERDHVLAVAERQQRELLARRGTPRAPPRSRRSAARRRRRSTASRASASVGADDHALAGREPVGLQHRRVGGAGDRARAPPRGERRTAWEAVGTPASRHQLLGVQLRALEPRRLGAGPEGGDALVLERVDEPGHERRLGADDDQVDGLVRGGRDERRRRPPAPTSRQRASAAIPALPGAQRSSGRPRRARRARGRSRARARLRRRREPSRRARLERLAKSSAGIAASVWLLIVPREPSSTETLAIVFSSGASTIVMKSYWPSVAHCSMTLTPELLDLLVHLLDPGRVVLQRLNPLGGQVGEHHECRHRSLLSVSCLSRPLSFTFAPMQPACTSGPRSSRVPEHPIFARFYDRMTAGTERAGLARDARASCSRGVRPDARARRGHRAQPRRTTPARSPSWS